MGISIKPVDHGKYGRYYTLYVRDNIFMRFDWNDRVRMIQNDVLCYFTYYNNETVGGFIIEDGRVEYPFLVDGSFGWKRLFSECFQFLSSKNNVEIEMRYLQEEAARCLVESFGGEIKMRQRIMVRPTDILRRELHEDFYFSEIEEDDFEDIVDVVYRAHKNGFTESVHSVNRENIEGEIKRRFNLFSKTETLGLGCVVRCKEHGDIAGVCIAGIYPDSPNEFATINQISVHPKVWGRGIASAMMARCVTNASEVSPSITLGVMIGNPAEKLYEKLGFRSGPGYYEMSIKN